MPAYIASESYAKGMDEADPLSEFRSQFYIPQHAGNDAIYLCGNSLGLQPKTAREVLDQELVDWQNLGVEGHFKAKRPWLDYHKNFSKYWESLIGCKAEEVVVMNNLTVNLHLLMVSFYQPSKTRFKIIMEGHAFPSDQYAVASQVAFHGFAPEEAIIEINPEEGTDHLTTQQITAAIQAHGDSVALVLFSGVQYYTGQFFDIEAITKTGHDVGAIVGFDLAHAVGNLPLELNAMHVDFATWCSYKYLNSGPGGVSGIYVNEKHATNQSIHRFAGWWGTNEQERFKMKKQFDPIPTAEGWQLSNAPVFNMACHLASLKIFEEAGIYNLRNKSIELTGYLYYLLEKLSNETGFFRIITPVDSEDRGCQLSLFFDRMGKGTFDYLTKNGVVADWREPNVIRIAPVPLYNRFHDVYKFYALMNEAFEELE